MKLPKGISFEIGKDNCGWFVDVSKLKLLHVRPSRCDKDARYGGFKFDLLCGKLRRPIPKFYKWQFWSKDYMIKEPATNSWNSGKHWFILTIPWCVGVFVSISFGSGKRQPGLYIGMKTYEVNAISQGLGKYNVGNPEECLHKEIYPVILAWGNYRDSFKIYLCPSLSFREDLVD